MTKNNPGAAPPKREAGTDGKDYLRESYRMLGYLNLLEQNGVDLDANELKIAQVAQCTVTDAMRLMFVRQGAAVVLLQLWRRFAISFHDVQVISVEKVPGDQERQLKLACALPGARGQRVRTALAELGVPVPGATEETST